VSYLDLVRQRALTPKPGPIDAQHSKVQNETNENDERSPSECIDCGRRLLSSEEGACTDCLTIQQPLPTAAERRVIPHPVRLGRLVWPKLVCLICFAEPSDALLHPPELQAPPSASLATTDWSARVTEWVAQQKATNERLGLTN
jgi:hypothetical protein